MILLSYREMDIIIHDLELESFSSIFRNIDEKKFKIISDNKKIKNCKGCFECWIKTPGKCVIKDGYQDLGESFSKADKIIIISKCYYGGYSPFVKKVLDRSIPYLLPFFRIEDNEIHHKIRYKKKFRLEVHFYGENIDREVKNTANELVKANSINLNLKEYRIFFDSSFTMLKNQVLNEGG